MASPLPEYAKKISRLCTSDFGDVLSLENFISKPLQISPAMPSVSRSYHSRSPYPVIDASQMHALLEKYVGQRIEIVGQISNCHSSTAYGRRYMLLNMTHRYPNHTFTLVLWERGLSAFDATNDPSKLAGQWVSVTGVVQEYSGKPQIEIENPSQIKQHSDRNAAMAALTANTSQSTDTRWYRKPPYATTPAYPTPIDSVRSKESKVASTLYPLPSTSTNSQNSNKYQPAYGTYQPAPQPVVASTTWPQATTNPNLTPGTPATGKPSAQKSDSSIRSYWWLLVVVTVPVLLLVGIPLSTSFTVAPESAPHISTVEPECDGGTCATVLEGAAVRARPSINGMVTERLGSGDSVGLIWILCL